MTQADRTLIEVAVLCLGAVCFLPSFVASLDDIIYLIEVFWWISGYLLSPRYRSFEEYRAAEELSDILDSLGRDFKRFRGITIVMPYRESAGLSTEAGS